MFMKQIRYSVRTISLRELVNLAEDIVQALAALTKDRVVLVSTTGHYVSNPMHVFNRSMACDRTRNRRSS
jgi:flagellar biosynthesis GTPase FlhF